MGWVAQFRPRVEDAGHFKAEQPSGNAGHGLLYVIELYRHREGRPARGTGRHAEPRVRESLSEAGIGADGTSSYHPPDIDRQAVVRIEFDPANPAPVKRHFAIVKFFDTQSRLERVEAKDWLTGP